MLRQSSRNCSASTPPEAGERLSPERLPPRPARDRGGTGAGGDASATPQKRKRQAASRAVCLKGEELASVEILQPLRACGKAATNAAPTADDALGRLS
jgi:hypothetical protein